jgi:hypothetical protein
LRKDCAVNMVNKADPEQLLDACRERWEHTVVSSQLPDLSLLEASQGNDGQQQNSRRGQHPAYGGKAEKTSTLGA